jgi:DNA-binding XRE family transcriptional regulator
MLRLRELLEKKRKTQVWLSDELCVSKISVNNWVQNKNQPSLETALKICKVLDVKISDLIIQN